MLFVSCVAVYRAPLRRGLFRGWGRAGLFVTSQATYSFKWLAAAVWLYWVRPICSPAPLASLTCRPRKSGASLLTVPPPQTICISYVFWLTLFAKSARPQPLQAQPPHPARPFVYYGAVFIYGF